MLSLCMTEERVHVREREKYVKRGKEHKRRDTEVQRFIEFFIHTLRVKGEEVNLVAITDEKRIVLGKLGYVVSLAKCLLKF